MLEEIWDEVSVWTERDGREKIKKDNTGRRDIMEVDLVKDSEGRILSAMQVINQNVLKQKKTKAGENRKTSSGKWKRLERAS